MRIKLLLIVVLLLLSACKPSQQQIEEAIKKTQAVQATVVAGEEATKQSNESLAKASTATSEAKLSQTATIQAAIKEAEIAATATFEASCGRESLSEAFNKTQDIVNRMADKTSLAQSTARIALTPVIADIQSLRREADKLEVPSCMMKAKTALAESINEMADGLLDFMTQKDDEAATHFNTGNKNIDLYRSEIERLNKCAPNCR